MRGFTKYTPKFYIFMGTLGSNIILTESSLPSTYIMHLLECHKQFSGQTIGCHHLRLILGEVSSVFLLWCSSGCWQGIQLVALLGSPFRAEYWCTCARSSPTAPVFYQCESLLRMKLSGQIKRARLSRLLFIFRCKPCLLDHHSISTFIAENAQLPLRPKQISWSQNLRATD